MKVLISSCLEDSEESVRGMSDEIYKGQCAWKSTVGRI